MSESPQSTASPPSSPPPKTSAQSQADSRSWTTWVMGIFLMVLCTGTIFSLTCYWPHFESKRLLLKTPDGTRDTLVMTAPEMSAVVHMPRVAYGWPDSASRAHRDPQRYYRKHIIYFITPERRFIILAVLAGILGAFIHMATSFGAFVGAGKLLSSWNWWYMLRPFIGGALALGVYMLLRAGLIVGSSAVDSMNPFGVGAICFLSGMFSKQAARKLEEVLDLMLSLKKDDLPHKLS